MPLGRMDWSCTDFWLAVETGRNRSSTATSPCTPYPLPSELQRDKHSTLEKARFLAERIGKTDYVNTYDKKTQSAILHAK